MEKININEKFSLFSDHWNPKIIGELNDQHIKLAKVEGEFVWHSHEHEDEMFLVMKGRLKMMFRDRTVVLNEGEMIVVPKGVEHKPVADNEVQIMLIEPANIKHTGDVDHDLTVKKYERI